MSRIGLVLGAGGIAGHAFHAGVLDALCAEAGWHPDDAEVVVGTSAGSGVAALLRGGMEPADIARRIAGEPMSARAARLVRQRAGRSGAQTAAAEPLAPAAVGNGHAGPAWFGLGPSAPQRFLRAAIRPWDARIGTLAAAALPEGRVPTERIVAGLRRVYPDGEWPERALWICAVRLDDGRRVVFGRDPGSTDEAGVPEAVAASCAIPGFFQPVRIGGVRHVDGGAWSPSNADVLAGLGLDLVIVVSPMSAQRTIPALSVDGALRAACRLQLTQEVVKLRRGGTPVVVIEPGADELAAMGSSAQAMDPQRAPGIVRTVRETMRRRLRETQMQERLEPLGA
ncbi:MAG TPA: patatin-like phospholipase family protein [Candidatus Dormibacteraeota bacterium]|jgi:NTE family protein|nr:patatin-like phospholipase family protein [Candidatus Dormibacteraeota bacterium]